MTRRAVVAIAIAAAGAVALLLRSGASLNESLTATLVAAAVALAAVRSWGPRRRTLLPALALVVLGPVFASGLARPLPFLPIVLPVGSHASPEAFARAVAPPELPLRVLVRRDWYAVALFAEGGDIEFVQTYRTALGGWFGGGGGRSSDAVPDGLRIVALTSASWSAGSLPGDGPHAALVVHGIAPSGTARVEIRLAEGTAEEATLNGGYFLWLRALRPVPAPDRSERLEDVLGVRFDSVVAYDVAGAVIARQPLR